MYRPLLGDFSQAQLFCVIYVGKMNYPSVPVSRARHHTVRTRVNPVICGFRDSSTRE